MSTPTRTSTPSPMASRSVDAILDTPRALADIHADLRAGMAAHPDCYSIVSPSGRVEFVPMPPRDDRLLPAPGGSGVRVIVNIDDKDARRDADQARSLANDAHDPSSPAHRRACGDALPRL